MKVATIVGARPEFIQVTPFTREVRKRHEEVLVHTGQHYDDDMSRVFFDELKLPAPTINLGVGQGTHGAQTGTMMTKIERVLLDERPDWVVVFGDTNSTLAGALAAAKLNIPVAHIEAGLRSFDRTMPEEINRILVDHSSTLLLAPTLVAIENLSREGLGDKAVLVGDIRVDVIDEALLGSQNLVGALRDKAGLSPRQPYALSTLHRASNTDDAPRLTTVLAALGTVQMPVVLPVHPRLARRMEELSLSFPPNVRPLPPLSFLQTVALLKESEFVITDSGGLQKEAYLIGRPTITLRDSTEWTETITAGWNRLAQPERESFATALKAVQRIPSERPALYGEPGVAQSIVRLMESYLEEHKVVRSASPQ